MYSELINRNAVCYCGSGKRYKNCHGKKYFYGERIVIIDEKDKLKDINIPDGW